MFQVYSASDTKSQARTFLFIQDYKVNIFLALIAPQKRRGRKGRGGEGDKTKYPKIKTIEIVHHTINTKCLQDESGIFLKKKSNFLLKIATISEIKVFNLESLKKRFEFI